MVHWKVCNKTFQNLDLKSLKIVLKPDQSLIWKILEFGKFFAKTMFRVIYKEFDKYFEIGFAGAKCCILTNGG